MDSPEPTPGISSNLIESSTEKMSSNEGLIVASTGDPRSTIVLTEASMSTGNGGRSPMTIFFIKTVAQASGGKLVAQPKLRK
jgi:hypothetical protein